MEFEELKEIANRVERSGSHRSTLDAECINKNISMVNRLVITRLIFVYQKFRNKEMTEDAAKNQVEDIKEMWEKLNDQGRFCVEC